MFEQTLGRKFASHPTSFYGTGRAGDLSIRVGTEPRNEEQAHFFKDLHRDSPTFIRYLASLPAKPETSPHLRRQLWHTQRQNDATSSDRSLVADLKFAGVDDD